MGLSLIVPTYNESENIYEVIDRVESSLKGFNFEVIVVDDNSPDDTASIAEELGRIYRNIRVLRRPCKFGLASAVLDGLKIAEYDVIGVIDADLQHPPELLPRMLEKIDEGYDIVIASRHVDGGGIEGWGRTRRIMSDGAIMLAHLLLPRTRTIKDPVSGFFLFKKRVADGVKFSSAGSFKILLEMLVRGKHESVVEVPYVFKPRRRGRSKLGLKEMAKYALLILKLVAKA